MNEAERYLAEKMRKPSGTVVKTVSAKTGGAEDRVGRGGPPDDGAAGVTERKEAPSGKAWSVGMAIFTFLMIMFWMAVFKGGCR